ncbi:MAG: chorismate synthase, partial [Desulfobacterales bacterium]
MSSTFGTLYRVTTFGESHGRGVGAIVDGYPPRIPLAETDIQPQLDRRRPGQSRLTTDRAEADRVTILSGVENGLTLGTPIAIVVANKDQKPSDYKQMQAVPRPSHADYTYQVKYGIRAASGGGRSSARETIARVAAGAMAEKFLLATCGVDIVAWVSAVGSIGSPEIDIDRLTRADVDRHAVRCPDPQTADRMQTEIEAAKEEKDSIGGIVS